MTNPRESSSPVDAASGREPRSRVLLVAPEPCREASGLVDRMGEMVVRVSSPFGAVGEVARAAAREPIELVLLAESAVSGLSQTPGAALRRVDPALRVVLVKDGPLKVEADHQNGTQAPPLSEDGFDSVLRDWPDAETLTAMLRGGGRTAAIDPQDNCAQKPPPKRKKEVAARPPASDKKQSADPLSSQQQLGDVDLVDAVMRGDGELKETALELIRQHTGWKDVWLSEEEAGDAESGAAPVMHGDRALGSLHSSAAAPKELARWADWLGRWLALDAEHRRWQELAYRDELTGAFNRRYFKSFLSDAIRDAAKKRLPVSVMVFDLDDFKRYNDEYGHAAGDEILRETVRLLNSVIRKSDRVCRIGGDEFAVIFTDPGGPRERGSAPPETAEKLAQRFQDQVCTMRFPKLGIEAPGTLSVSAGLAMFPWDGWDPEALLNHADALALQSKRKGKNALTLGRASQEAACRTRGETEATESNDIAEG